MRWVTVLVTAGVVGVFGLYLVGKAARPDKANSVGLNLEAARRLPVLDGGRVKPLDTFARTALRILSTKEEFDDASDTTQPAIRWFMEVASHDVYTRNHQAPPAEQRTGIFWSARVFSVNNDEVLNLLKVKGRSGFRYSLKELYDHYGDFEREAAKAEDVPKDKRDLFQNRVLELYRRHQEFKKVNQQYVHILPPKEAGGKWETPAEVRKELEEQAFNEARDAIRAKMATEKIDPKDLADDKVEALVREAQADAKARYRTKVATDPRMSAWEDLVAAYTNRNPEKFDDAVKRLAACSAETVPAKKLQTARFEVFFNHFEPFVDSVAMYGVAMVLAAAAMLLLAVSPTFAAAPRWAAVGLAVLTLGVHTFGLVARMYIQNRPPVTNLYSSAIFIGWGGVLFGLVLELIFRRGIAVAVGSLLGMVTTIVAHNLGTNDTLEMMQAVLDTNFWLATHVVIVTLGYTATFLAGLLAVAYILFGVFSPLVDQGVAKKFSQMIYGVLCAALLMSFVGTVLGGIWADQSWGRFWGWDPKENGAVLIVIWNALVLHARWGGLVKQRGIAVLAVFGNVVTAWSWFGTNMLGIGLHSYGFMEGWKEALIGFYVGMFAIMAIGLVPRWLWLSTVTHAAPRPA